MHWIRNIILTKLSSLVALKVVICTTSSESSEQKFHENDVFVSVCQYHICGRLYKCKPYNLSVIIFGVNGLMAVWPTKIYINHKWGCTSPTISIQHTIALKYLVSIPPNYGITVSRHPRCSLLVCYYGDEPLSWYIYHFFKSPLLFRTFGVVSGDLNTMIRHTYRDHSVYAPSQWETVLQCNALSHWQGAYTEWSLPIECLH